jgi:hypothetical protein
MSYDLPPDACASIQNHIMSCTRCQKSLLCDPHEKKILKSVSYAEMFLYIFTVLAILYVMAVFAERR